MPAIGNIDELVATISDHAVLRYLERAYGLDVGSVRAEMSRGLETAISFGARTVICHGVRLIISEDGCVVTALPKRRAGRGRGQLISTEREGFHRG
jgi:hypothetical protein